MPSGRHPIRVACVLCPAHSSDLSLTAASYGRCMPLGRHPIMCVTNAACPLGGTRSLQVFAYYGSLNALREAADHKQNDCCMPHGRHPICGSLYALREAADHKQNDCCMPLGRHPIVVQVRVAAQHRRSPLASLQIQTVPFSPVLGQTVMLQAHAFPPEGHTFSSALNAT